MDKLLSKAKSLNNRVILVGDTKQLSAINAGAPFKLLQDAGLPTAVIDQNLRQRSPILKQVVNEIANSDIDSNSINNAYQKLNEQGKIQQIVSDEARVETDLVKDVLLIDQTRLPLLLADDECHDSVID